MGVVLYMTMIKLQKQFIVCFTPVLYMIQEDVESYDNQLSSYDLICTAIYTSPGLPKSCFYVYSFKRNNMWLCKWVQLLFQLLMLMFGPNKMICYNRVTYVP